MWPIWAYLGHCLCLSAPLDSDVAYMCPSGPLFVLILPPWIRFGLSGPIWAAFCACLGLLAPIWPIWAHLGRFFCSSGPPGSDLSYLGLSGPHFVVICPPGADFDYLGLSGPHFVLIWAAWF